jgi:hypothetical protein
MSFLSRNFSFSVISPKKSSVMEISATKKESSSCMQSGVGENFMLD